MGKELMIGYKKNSIFSKNTSKNYNPNPPPNSKPSKNNIPNLQHILKQPKPNATNNNKNPTSKKKSTISPIPSSTNNPTAALSTITGLLIIIKLLGIHSGEIGIRRISWTRTVMEINRWLLWSRIMDPLRWMLRIVRIITVIKLWRIRYCLVRTTRVNKQLAITPVEARWEKRQEVNERSTTIQVWIRKITPAQNSSEIRLWT